MIKKNLKLLLCLLLSTSIIGCTSMTTIRVTDPEVRIFVNGEFLGTGSATYADAKMSGSANHVSLRKEGCAESNYVFTRSEQPDVGAIIGGIFLLIPFLWTMGYRPYRSYEFHCSGKYQN